MTERFLGNQKIGTTGRGSARRTWTRLRARAFECRTSSTRNCCTRRSNTLTNRNQIFVKVFNRMPFDPDKVTEELLAFAEPLRGYVADTGLLLNKALDKAGLA